MPPAILTVLGSIILIGVIVGLISGKVIAGSKGFRSNYYSKEDNPFLYYSFLVIYSLIGSFLLYNSI